MIDKNAYYHGAAIVSLLEDGRCHSVRKHGLSGYVVNNSIFIFLKYTTKARTPWGFTFDQEDIDRCFNMSSLYKRVILGLICGGDGICALDWSEANGLLAGKPGRISTGRKHKKRYEVWGTEGELKGKIAINHWPSLLFEQDMITSDNLNNNIHAGTTT